MKAAGGLRSKRSFAEAINSRQRRTFELPHTVAAHVKVFENTILGLCEDATTLLARHLHDRTVWTNLTFDGDRGGQVCPGRLPVWRYLDRVLGT